MSDDDDIARWVKALDRGFLPREEFVSKVVEYASQSAERADEVLERMNALSSHHNASVQDAARRAGEFAYQRKTHIKDIGHIRRTSPLQSGTRLSLGGGYTAAYNPPQWLSGRASLMATFIDFVDRGTDKMPGAMVQFDDEIDLPGVQGRYALLTLRYVADWQETETVAVHVTDIRPAEIAAFAAAPPASSEVESHATYVIDPPAASTAKTDG